MQTSSNEWLDVGLEGFLVLTIVFPYAYIGDNVNADLHGDAQSQCMFWHAHFHLAFFISMFLVRQKRKKIT